MVKGGKRATDVSELFAETDDTGDDSSSILIRLE